MQDGVVQLAGEPQRPEVGALRHASPRRRPAARALGPAMVSVARRVSRSISTFTLE